MLIFAVWYYKVMIAFTYCWSRNPRKTHSSWCPRVPLKGKEEYNWCEFPGCAQPFFHQVGRQEKRHCWLLARSGRSVICQGKIAQGQMWKAQLSKAQLQPCWQYKQLDFLNSPGENGLN